jgi:excisionase family DNA binding protein
MSDFTTLVNIDELAEIIKIPKQTIYWLVHKKRIPHYKMVKSLRFDVAAVLNHYKRSSAASDRGIEPDTQPSSLTIESTMRKSRDLRKRRF